jgi:NAD(P)-dependent dehydrogenase (short-subunit alcohol dehydrogenase family)
MTTATFGATSTTDEVLAGIDLSGKRILVTGVSAGLGIETARSLVARGAHVVGAARDLGKAQAATAGVGAAAAAGGGGFELLALDLGDLSSVREATDRVRAAGHRLDAIIGNAGVMACPESRTASGFETQFGTNHIGHFVLIGRLAGVINDGGRIVLLSSSGHRFSDVDLADPNFEHTPYDPLVAYGRSKTANILCAVALDQRLRGRGIRATAVHPGVIMTELGRHMTEEMIAGIMASSQLTFKTLEQGAATSVWSGFTATPEAVGGRYCEDCHVAEVDDAAAGSGVRAYAVDPARAEALWTTSERLVAERFDLTR